MRTTVTLEPDVKQLIRERMRQTGEPFKQAMNHLIRQGAVPTRPKRRVKVRPLVSGLFKDRNPKDVLDDLLDEDFHRFPGVRVHNPVIG